MTIFSNIGHVDYPEKMLSNRTDRQISGYRQT